MATSIQSSDLKILDRELTGLVAKRDLHRDRIVEIEESLPKLQAEISDRDKALDLLLKIGAVYRKVSVERINSLVTMGLQAVFGRPYKYALTPEEKRGQIELSQAVRIEGMELDPATAMGGGVVDVVSFCLRVVVWSMMKHRSAPLMVLDEPFRCVSNEHVESAASLIKKISTKMGIQFLVVTHNESLASSGDKTYEVSIVNKASQAKLLQ